MSERPFYDPYSREINADPFASFKRLRDEAPLYYSEELDFYALSRFEDIQAARADVSTYSNTHGILFERMHHRNPELPRSMLTEMDPPEHARLRHVSARQFSPKVMAGLEDRVRKVCGHLLDEAGQADTFDYIAEVGK